MIVSSSFSATAAAGASATSTYLPSSTPFKWVMTKECGLIMAVRKVFGKSFFLNFAKTLVKLFSLSLLNQVERFTPGKQV
jgi:hypothetical protein